MSTSTASVVVHVWPLRARFTEIFIRVKVAQLQLSRQTYLRRGSTVRHTTGPLKAPFLLNYSVACSVKLGEELVLNLKWDSAAQPRHSIQTPHRLLLVLHSVQVHSEARRTASRDRRLAYPSHDQRRPLPVPMLRFAQPARVFLSAGSLKNDLRYNGTTLCVSQPEALTDLSFNGSLKIPLQSIRELFFTEVYFVKPQDDVLEENWHIKYWIQSPTTDNRTTLL